LSGGGGSIVVYCGGGGGGVCSDNGAKVFPDISVWKVT